MEAFLRNRPKIDQGAIQDIEQAMSKLITSGECQTTTIINSGDRVHGCCVGGSVAPLHVCLWHLYATAGVAVLYGVGGWLLSTDIWRT